MIFHCFFSNRHQSAYALKLTAARTPKTLWRLQGVAWRCVYRERPSVLAATGSRRNQGLFRSGEATLPFFVQEDLDLGSNRENFGLAPCHKGGRPQAKCATQTLASDHFPSLFSDKVTKRAIKERTKSGTHALKQDHFARRGNEFLGRTKCTTGAGGILRFGFSLFQQAKCTCQCRTEKYNGATRFHVFSPGGHGGCSVRFETVPILTQVKPKAARQGGDNPCRRESHNWRTRLLLLRSERPQEWQVVARVDKVPVNDYI